jgi:hypothetical protein
MSLFEKSVSGAHRRESSSSSSRRRSSSARHQLSSTRVSLPEGRAAVEGYLEKYTEASRKFSRRWFALDLGDGFSEAPCLRYSSSHDSAIPLSRIRDVRLGYDVPTLTQEPNLEFQFLLSGSGRVVRLRAPTVAECSGWISALEEYSGRGGGGESWAASPSPRRRSGGYSHSHSRGAGAPTPRGGGGGSPRGTPRHSPAAPEGVPPGWRSAFDRAGRQYWYNKQTGMRSWTAPQQLAGLGGQSLLLSPAAAAMAAAAAGAVPTTPTQSGHGRPVYGREHDPPPKGAHALLDLHVKEMGFFGVW